MAIGVYYRDNELNEWILHGTGLPNSPVFDLEINKTNNKLRAGTFGRGIWEIDLYE